MADCKLVRKHWRFLEKASDARFAVMYGGASSAKSWTIAPYLIVKLLKENGKGLLVLRKTGPAVRKSCYRLIKHWLSEWQVPIKENRTELIITLPSGSWIQFEGLDQVDKLKSIEGVNYIWMEEATEFGYLEFLQLHIRCRALNDLLNQLYLSFNPVDPVGNQWLEDITKLGAEGELLGSKVRVLHCTHEDNPFLSKEERDGIEALADADEEYDKIYRQGLWATPTQIIYSNWDIVDEFPVESKLDDVGYGLDFGYTNPTALVKVGVKENHLYVQEMIYERRLHNEQLIARLPEVIHDPDAVIIADSAEPAYIEEIQDAGWNCRGCVKSEGQKEKSFVTTGIDRVKRFQIHVTEDSPNIQEELRAYKWKTKIVAKQERVIPVPVDWMNHAMDAIRYFIGSKKEPVETEVIQIPSWLRDSLVEIE